MVDEAEKNWKQVCAQLDASVPDWQQQGRTGGDAAATAIRKLTNAGQVDTLSLTKLHLRQEVENLLALLPTVEDWTLRSHLQGTIMRLRRLL